MLLLNRLAAVADMVSKGEPVADIGADHALLPIYLVGKGIVPCAVIGELGDGPYGRACQAVQESRAKDKIEVRKGNGLQILKHGEVSTVVLAGMGGETIVEILSYDWDKSASFSRFIFQAMSKSGLLRTELANKGWPIMEERLVEENGHFYVIIASQPANITYKLSDLEIDIGPAILKADSELKRRFLKLYLKKYDKIYESLSRSEVEHNKCLAFDYKSKIERLETIIDASQS